MSIPSSSSSSFAYLLSPLSAPLPSSHITLGAPFFSLCQPLSRHVFWLGNRNGENVSGGWLWLIHKLLGPAKFPRQSMIGESSVEPPTQLRELYFPLVLFFLRALSVLRLRELSGNTRPLITSLSLGESYRKEEKRKVMGPRGSA